MNKPTITASHSPVNRVVAAPKSNFERFVSDAGFQTDPYFCSRLNVAPVSKLPPRQSGQSHSFTLDTDPRPSATSRAQNAAFSAIAAPETRTDANGANSAIALTMAEAPVNQSRRTLLAGGVPDVAGLTMAELEKLAIIQTLERCAGNRTKAARMLGLSVRTLQRKLSAWKLKCV